eukprot:504283_1
MITHLFFFFWCFHHFKKDCSNLNVYIYVYISHTLSADYLEGLYPGALTKDYHVSQNESIQSNGYGKEEMETNERNCQHPGCINKKKWNTRGSHHKTKHPGQQIAVLSYWSTESAPQAIKLLTEYRLVDKTSLAYIQSPNNIVHQNHHQNNSNRININEVEQFDSDLQHINSDEDQTGLPTAGLDIDTFVAANVLDTSSCF